VPSVPSIDDDDDLLAGIDVDGLEAGVAAGKAALAAQVAAAPLAANAAVQPEPAAPVVTGASTAAGGRSGKTRQVVEDDEDDSNVAGRNAVTVGTAIPANNPAEAEADGGGVEGHSVATERVAGDAHDAVATGAQNKAAVTSAFVSVTKPDAVDQQDHAVNPVSANGSGEEYDAFDRSDDTASASEGTSDAAAATIPEGGYGSTRQAARKPRQPRAAGSAAGSATGGKRKRVTTFSEHAVVAEDADGNAVVGAPSASRPREAAGFEGHFKAAPGGTTKRRKLQKVERHYVDEQGYLVTEVNDVWVTDDESPIEPAPHTAASPAGATPSRTSLLAGPSGGKSAGAGNVVTSSSASSKQSNMFSFFGKK
jgi:hypothetical protein